MKKTILSSILALASCMSLSAQTEICINGTWQFYYAKDEQVADSLAKTDWINDPQGKWDNIKVPSCWAVLGYEEPVYREFKDAPHSEGFYVHRFMVPKEFSGKRISLNFGGVWANAEVWVNGKPLGRHDSGYTSFSFPVTSIVKAGDENTIAVRVRQVYPGYVCDTYDDWSLGGIFRDVTLTTKPSKCWIDKVTVKTSPTGNERGNSANAIDAWNLNLGIMVYDAHKADVPGNYHIVGPGYQLRYILKDAGGSTILDETKAVEGHPSNGRQYDETFSLNGIKPWTAETPNLYTLSIELIEKGEVKQTEQQQIGFREISTKDGIFRINGQPVKLRGVNRHDEWPDVGRATTKEHWLKDLTMMKEANVNYIRACHYQHTKGFIEMCDSIGMYVGEEVCLGGAGDLMQNPQFVPGMALRISETVNRDLNEPCIIYWSVGNEDTFNQMYYDAAKMVKALDPTRPVLYPWGADLKFPKDIDIIAPHYWTSYEYDSLCANSTRPVITTEYVHAYGTQRFGGLADCWKALHDSPHGAGGAVWMWADQGIKTPKPWTDQKYKSLSGGDKYLRISGDGWDGITDSYRNPTRDFYELKNVYCPIYPVGADTEKHITVKIHNDYDFMTTKNIDILYKVYVDDKVIKEGTTRLDIAPHADADLVIPQKMPSLKAGQTAFVQIFFNRNSKEIGKKSLLLMKNEELRMKNSSVAKGGNSHSSSFTLNSSLKPVITHKMNEGDQICRLKFNGAKYSVRQEGDESIYQFNDSNYFSCKYKETAVKEGVRVDYSITPHLTSSRYTPIIGLQMQCQPLRWFGLGPNESYPNKKASEILGVWDAKSFDGTRAADWVEVLANGKKYRITFLNEGRNYSDGAHGYIDRDSKESKMLNLCSHILGRSEKGRLKDKNYRLEPSGATYSGSILIQEE